MDDGNGIVSLCALLAYTSVSDADIQAREANSQGRGEEDHQGGLARGYAIAVCFDDSHASIEIAVNLGTGRV